jgi:hypothetical protein
MTVPIKNASSVMSIPKIFATIEKTLVSHNARHITHSYDNERITAIEFVLEINGREYPFRLPARVKAVEKIMYGTDTRFLSKTQKEQAYRVAWANIRDWVSAQCALIDTQMVRPEEIFLPYMLDQQGRTFYEVMQQNQYLLPGGSEAAHE